MKLLPRTLRVQGTICVVGQPSLCRVKILDKDGTAPTEVFFESTEYTVSPDEGQLVVSAMRTRGGGTMSIDFSTSNETKPIISHDRK